MSAGHRKGTPARQGSTPQADVDAVISAYQRWRQTTEPVEQARALLDLDLSVQHAALHSTIYGPGARAQGERPLCATQDGRS